MQGKKKDWQYLLRKFPLRAEGWECVLEDNKRRLSC
jgi:hypothetical protein